MPAHAKARAKSKGRASRGSVNGVASSSAAASASRRRATWSSDRDAGTTSVVEASTIRAFQMIQAKIQAKIQAPDSILDETLTAGPAGLLKPIGRCRGREHLESKAAKQCARLEAGSKAVEQVIETPASNDFEAVADNEQDLLPEKLRSNPDPWLGVSDEDAMHRIYTESWHVVELQNIGDDETVQEELAELPEIEGLKSVHLSAKGAEVSEVLLCEPLALSCVSLDVSGNLLRSLESLPTMWLRSLSLADNPLCSLDGLSTLFPRLLCMDVSFVDLSSIHKLWSALAACSSLRSIDAEGANIHTLDGMQAMPSLLVLNLADNQVADLHVLSVLASFCKSLQCLDLRENPVALEMGYRQSVASELPNLVEHDNQSKRKYIPKPRDQICRPDPSGPKAVHVIDGLLQNERCSCLEGNPCIDPATCLDWQNRERVASNVRQSFHLPTGQWSMGFNFRV